MQVEENKHNSISTDPKGGSVAKDKTFSTDAHSNVSVSPSGVNAMHMNLFSPIGASSGPNSALKPVEEKNLTPTQIMHERWHRSNRNLP